MLTQALGIEDGFVRYASIRCQRRWCNTEFGKRLPYILFFILYTTLLRLTYLLPEEDRSRSKRVATIEYTTYNSCYVEIKRPTRCNRWFFIAKLIVRSTCFGHHYAHHQELKSIMRVVAACGTWCFGLQVVGLVWSCRLCVRSAGCYVSGTIMPIIRSSRVLYRWLFPVVLGALVYKPQTAPHQTNNL